MFSIFKDRKLQGQAVQLIEDKIRAIFSYFICSHELLDEIKDTNMKISMDSHYLQSARLSSPACWNPYLGPVGCRSGQGRVPAAGEPGLSPVPAQTVNGVLSAGYLSHVFCIFVLCAGDLVWTAQAWCWNAVLSPAGHSCLWRVKQASFRHSVMVMGPSPRTREERRCAHLCLRPVWKVLKDLRCTEGGNAATFVDPGEDNRSKSVVDSTVVRLTAKEI